MESTLKRVLRRNQAGTTESANRSEGVGRVGLSDICGDCGDLLFACIRHVVDGVCGCTPCPKCEEEKPQQARPVIDAETSAALQQALEKLGEAHQRMTERNGLDPRFNAARVCISLAMQRIREVLP